MSETAQEVVELTVRSLLDLSITHRGEDRYRLG